MSNLVQNGDFSNPDLSTFFDFKRRDYVGKNSYIYLNDLLNDGVLPYGWTSDSVSSLTSISLQNGISSFNLSLIHISEPTRPY